MKNAGKFDFEPLEGRVMLAGQFIADIPANPQGALDYVTAVGTELFFFVDDPTLGGLLYRSNGTAKGTRALKAINDSTPSNVTDEKLFAGGDGLLYFYAQNSDGSFGVGRSDGTISGTIFLQRFGGDHRFSSFVNVGGRVLFTVQDSEGKGSLWATDKTFAGATRLKADLALDNLNPQNVVDFVPRSIAGEFYFDTFNADFEKYAIWKTDGTAAGTVLVKDDCRGAYFAPFGNSVVFSGGTVGNFGLWRTDGTANGTRQIISGSSHPESVTEFTAFKELDGILFFVRFRSALWKTDGTKAGTAGLKSDVSPRQLNVVNGKLFFLGDGLRGLWSSVGTSTTTELVFSSTTEVAPNAFVQRKFDQLRVIGDKLFVVDTRLYSLWGSEGTRGGTQQIADHLPPPYGDSFAAIGNTLYIAQHQPHHGVQLWSVDINALSGSVSGSIFSDANLNGAKDSNETGLRGVSVYIDLNGDYVWSDNEPSTLTSSKGSYHIDDVPAGKCWLRMEHVNGYAATRTESYRIAVPALGEVVKKFGVTQGGTLRGVVFNDLNGNGIQDAGDVGLPNFRVWIDLDNDGILDDKEPTTHTNSVGKFALADLLPGNYRIRQKPQAGWRITTRKAFSFSLSAGATSTKRFGDTTI